MRLFGSCWRKKETQEIQAQLVLRVLREFRVRQGQLGLLGLKDRLEIPVPLGRLELQVQQDRPELRGQLVLLARQGKEFPQAARLAKS